MAMAVHTNPGFHEALRLDWAEAAWPGHDPIQVPGKAAMWPIQSGILRCPALTTAGHVQETCTVRVCYTFEGEFCTLLYSVGRERLAAHTHTHMRARAQACALGCAPAGAAAFVRWAGGC